MGRSARDWNRWRKLVYPSRGIRRRQARQRAGCSTSRTRISLYCPAQAAWPCSRPWHTRLPVIVARGDGTQDDLVRDENGWQIPPDDYAALVAALRTALSDTDRLRRMGRGILPDRVRRDQPGSDGGLFSGGPRKHWHEDREPPSRSLQLWRQTVSANNRESIRCAWRASGGLRAAGCCSHRAYAGGTVVLPGRRRADAVRDASLAACLGQRGHSPGRLRTVRLGRLAGLHAGCRSRGCIAQGRAGNPCVMWPLLLGAVVGIVLVIADRLFSSMAGQPGISPSCFSAFPGGLGAAAIGEEILFRGFVMGLWASCSTSLLRKWNGLRAALWIGNAIAALAFSASHLPAAMYPAERLLHRRPAPALHPAGTVHV